MIQLRVIQHLQDRMNGTRLGVIRTVYQTADAGVNHCSRTHGARFNCSKQFTVTQTMVTAVGTCVSQRDEFCMGSGIVVGKIAIPTPADYSAFANDYRSHRHFAHFQSAMRAA